ncbi:IS30 family transposase [Cryobacterium sp. PH31-O1]|uniref:IS30 family transposase n=1 Tax=Cryobacterium sp. PH31-O1 TaxID=3046306 RepID=UPI0032D8C9C7
MSQFSISGLVICGQRAAIPSEPFMRQGDLSHTRHPRVIDTLRQSRNHPPQQRKEGDLVCGAFNRSAIATLVERTTGFLILVHLGDKHDAVTVRKRVGAAMSALPAHLRKTLTWDQGSEMSEYHQFKENTTIPVYFCDPHSPWQRGSNENTNGLVRQYFPKGTNLNLHSPERLAEVAAKINARPRESRNWEPSQTHFDRLKELAHI